jgi:beta-lactamase superfamily II metal-dependent hydrolase
MIEIELLPAQYGDCIWLRYGETAESLRHVLIDTGFVPTATAIRKRLAEDRTIVFELMVMTHIDADHIEGSAHLFQDAKVVTPARFKEIWFNGWRHLVTAKTAKDTLGSKQGEYLSALIGERGIPWNERFGGAPVYVPPKGKLPRCELDGGLKLTLLSPTLEKLKKLHGYWVKNLAGKLKPGDERAAMKLLAKDKKYAADALGTSTNVAKLAQAKFKEDAAEANGSSIAFLAEYDDKTMLFTGDAHPSVMTSSLARLEPKKKVPIDLFKVSHHGSKNNTSPALLEYIDPVEVVFSTNGKKFNHPDPECVARIIAAKKGRPVTLHFNYATKQTTPWVKNATKTGPNKYEAVAGRDGALTIRL